MLAPLCDRSTPFTGTTIVTMCALPMRSARLQTRAQVAGEVWFGGGCDLTPFYIHEGEVAAFHGYWKSVCDKRQPGLHARLKAWCDE